MIWIWALLICQLVWLPPGQAVYHNLSATWFTATLHRPDAYFGYSITYEPTSKRLIVGAPQGNDIGEIYSCDIDSKVCTNIPTTIKRSDPTYNHTYWLGAVVKAGPSYFVACAPLNVERKLYTAFNITKNLIGTFSSCYKYTSLSEPPATLTSLSEEERKKYTFLFEQKMDSFGWSIDIAGNNIIIGSPAMFTGRAIKYYDINKNPVSLTGVSSDPNKGVHYNFGYSVVTGFFKSSGKMILTYAVGSPYGRNGYGVISFYLSYKKNDMHYQGDLTGSDESTVGSMFGAVLCAARLTPGSLATALVVGAPTYATKHTYNLGAVYIYEAGKLPLNRLLRKIVGQQDDGFFGSAIVSVGDLNGDGRDEIAIGAPYEDSGSGAVYLYSSADIVSEKAQIGWMQRITAEPKQRQRTFGLSLTAVQDYDENGCNELAIGAPETNKVMLLRCIASVIVRLYEEIPDLRKFKGNNNPSRNDTNFEFSSCLEVIYPEKPKYIAANIKVQLQIIHPDAKLARPEDKEYSIFLDRKQNFICKKIVIETPENGNYGFPIMYKIKATQLENPVYKMTKFEPYRVALSDLSKLNSSNSIWIAECSDTNNCMPKLKYMDTKLSVTSPYVIGSTKTIGIEVTVKNEGEVAYDPCLRITFDNATVAQLTPDCERVNGSELQCAPKQILRTNNIWSTKVIELEVTHLTNEYESITAHINMYNHCTQKTFDTFQKVITLIADYNGVFIKGVTDAGLDDMVNMTKTDVALGKVFEHSYMISNSGPTNWVGVPAKLVIQKRSFVENFTIILSMENVPGGPQKCEFVGESKQEATFSCNIEKLFKNAGFAKITVPMFVKPGMLDNAIAMKQNTIYSHLILDFDGGIRNSSVNSILNLKGATVPLWIILAASLIGLIMLLIVFFILRECGFFRREKKEDLRQVRRSVKRQTILRRSMIEGVRLPPGPDRQSLIQPERAAGKDRRVQVDDAAPKS